VILVQTPFTVASAIQRLGRAGHSVGEASSGVLFPLHGKDIVDAAVMARCVHEQDITDLSVTTCPLDVLAQVIVSMASTETWHVDEMYDLVCTSAPYRELPRRQFDLVLDMLAGKYAETRLRDLSPLISWDRLDGTVRATPAARMRLVTGGGTIPDRGNFSLRAAGSQALIGELDEEFVWERSLGDSFVFGAQAWRIQKIDHQNVEVVPVAQKSGMSPFWKAEERGRDFHFSDRISRALEEWDGRVSREGFAAEAAAEYGMDPDAAQAMTGFLLRQREATGSGLPHRHRVLVEHTRDPDGRDGSTTIVLHTLWGGKVNKPFALALSAALEERLGAAPQMYQTDDAILLFPAEEMQGREILSLVNPENIERLLRRRLEGSGFFGARFRESAGRALLLPRPGARRRIPFWLTRQRARSLYTAVSRYDDFPLLLEAWRTCLRDEFDLPSLDGLLGELAAGDIRVEDVATSSPSPFCGELVWRQTNTLMYQDDSPPGPGGTALRGDLVRELALSPDLRPRIDPRIAGTFREKLQRTAGGYAPRDSRELLDWVKERGAIPADEWGELLAACVRDSGRTREELLMPLAGKISEQSFGDSRIVSTAAVESLPGIRRALSDAGGEALGTFISEWLRFEGPVDPSLPAAVFGLPRDLLDTMIEDLVEEESVVLDRMLAGSEALLLCDRENLESLLRITRASARPAFSMLPLSELPHFIAERQGLTRRDAGPERLRQVAELLLGCPLPAHLWEEEVFPARVKGYQGRWLDSLLSDTNLIWLGCGRRRITFCFRQDIELFDETATVSEEARALFPGASGRFSFWDLLDAARSGGTGQQTSAELAADLWKLAWDGAVSSDSLLPLRRGIANGFRAEEPAREQGRRRGSFERWQAARPSSGFWFLVPRGAVPGDLLEAEDVVRDRVRQLLARYGVLFRELLENELPPLRWGRVFRSLRLMEFSGEVVTGRFFDGIPGLQFALPSVLEKAGATDDAVWWVNAADPASLCGIDLEGLKGTLPSRLSTTHVVYQGSSVVLVSRRRGRDLEIRVPAAEPIPASYLEFVREITGREQRAPGAVHVETINGEPACDSSYRGRLVELGFVEEYRRLTFRAQP
jgi:ATP-dependent Lhr-like helicase